MSINKGYYIEQPNINMEQNGIEFFLCSVRGADICTTRAHIHESIEFLFITNGCFRIYSDNRSFQAESGDLVMFTSHSVHCVFSMNECENSYYVLKIKPSVLLALSDPELGASYVMRFLIRGGNDRILWKKDELFGSGILGCFERMIYEYTQMPAASEVMLKLEAVSLLVEILRYNDDYSRFSGEKSGNVSIAYQIYESISYINKNYSSPITAKDCAKAVNMSYSYFSRSFKEVTGKTFRQYLCSIRLSHAEEAMLMTGKSVTEICYDCGFTDTSYFIAQYKKARGVTPYQFMLKNSVKASFDDAVLITQKR